MQSILHQMHSLPMQFLHVVRKSYSLLLAAVREGNLLHAIPYLFYIQGYKEDPFSSLKVLFEQA
jgi:hypothetical protein